MVVTLCYITGPLTCILGLHCVHFGVRRSDIDLEAIRWPRGLAARVHHARPTHPHRTIPRPRRARKIPSPVPRARQTWCLQVCRWLAESRVSVFIFITGYVLILTRRSYTFLHTSTTVPIVPPRHDQYPRFLSAAWPYYAGAISTSVGFFLFSALWLAGDVKGERKNLKTTKSD